MHQRTWQFRLTNGNVIDCAFYFDKRASKVAAALNCQVVTSNVVKIEFLSDSVRKVVGNALLMNVIELPKDLKRRRSCYQPERGRRRMCILRLLLGSQPLQ